MFCRFRRGSARARDVTACLDRGRPGSLPPMRTPSLGRVHRPPQAWDRSGGGRGHHVRSRRAGRFAAFGDGSLICFPWSALFGEERHPHRPGHIIGPYASLSAGMVPGQSLLPTRS